MPVKIEQKHWLSLNSEGAGERWKMPNQSPIECAFLVSGPALQGGVNYDMQEGGEYLLELILVSTGMGLPLSKSVLNFFFPAFRRSFLINK